MDIKFYKLLSKLNSCKTNGINNGEWDLPDDLKEEIKENITVDNTDYDDFSNLENDRHYTTGVLSFKIYNRWVSFRQIMFTSNDSYSISDIEYDVKFYEDEDDKLLADNDYKFCKLIESIHELSSKGNFYNFWNNDMLNSKDYKIVQQDKDVVKHRHYEISTTTIKIYGRYISFEQVTTMYDDGSSLSDIQYEVDYYESEPVETVIVTYERM